MRGGTAGKERFRLRGFLVVGQTALAVVLLVGGGLLLRSFGNLTDVDPGFRGASVVSVSLSLPQVGYPETRRHGLLSESWHAPWSSLPGVASPASCSGLR
jgi:putative ABC transport system permease protein